MTAFEIFDRLEQTAIGEAIRNSSWLFPVVEAVHLVGLALLGGAVLLVGFFFRVTKLGRV